MHIDSRAHKHLQRLYSLIITRMRAITASHRSAACLVGRCAARWRRALADRLGAVRRREAFIPVYEPLERRVMLSASQIDDQLMAVADHAPADAVVGQVLLVQDNGDVAGYRIASGNSDSDDVDVFAIDASGLITVNPAVSIDFVNDSTYALQVEVVDAADAALDTATVTVQVDPFADGDLADSVGGALGLADGLLPTYDQLSNDLVGLTVVGNAIDSLVGLEHALNLTTLSLTPHTYADAPGALGDLSPLSGLASLGELTVHRYSLDDAALATLASPTGLHTLDVRHNAVATVPQAVADAPALQTLVLGANPIAESNDFGVALASLAGSSVHLDLPSNLPGEAAGIADLAARLFYSPTRMYQWVRNHIEFQPYAGAMKGAEAVWQTRAGNAWDTAALLAALLNEAGLTTRFVSGPVTMTEATAMEYLGTVTPYAALSVLYHAGLNPVSDETNQQITFDHAWVEVDLSGSWTPLDAAWKYRAHRDGAINMLTEGVAFDADGYLSEVRNNPASEYYEGQVRSYLSEHMPGIGVADLAYQGQIIPVAVESLPAPNPGEPRKDTMVDYWLPDEALLVDHGSSIPDSLTHRVRIALRGYQGTLTHEGPSLRTYFASDILPVPAIALSTIAIEHDITGSEAVHSLFIDSIQQETAWTSVDVDEEVIVYIDVFEPDGDDVFERQYKHTIDVDEYVVIGLEANQYTSSIINREHRALNEAMLQHAGLDPSALPDQRGLVGQFLKTAIWSYFDQTSRSTLAVANMTGAIPRHNLVASGVVTSKIDVIRPSDGFDMDLQYPFVPQALSLDIPNGDTEAVSIFGTVDDVAGLDQLRRDRLVITGYSASALEGMIWEQMANIPSISTIRSLQLANASQETGQGVVVITGSELDQIESLINLPAHLDDAVEGDIRSIVEGVSRLSGLMLTPVGSSEQVRLDIGPDPQNVVAGWQEWSMSDPLGYESKSLSAGFDADGFQVSFTSVDGDTYSLGSLATVSDVLADGAIIPSSYELQLNGLVAGAYELYLFVGRPEGEAATLTVVTADANGVSNVVYDPYDFGVIPLPIQSNGSHPITIQVQDNDDGYTVTTPKMITPIGNDDPASPLWNGVGYLVEHRVKGATGYRIRGGYGTDVEEAHGGHISGIYDQVSNFWDALTHTKVGDPINPATGTVYHDETDFALPNLGVPLAFGRHYKSGLTGQDGHGFDRGMGSGWSFSFSDRLYVKGVSASYPGDDNDPDGSAVWLTDRGDLLKFESYPIPADHYAYWDFNVLDDPPGQPNVEAPDRGTAGHTTHIRFNPAWITDSELTVIPNNSAVGFAPGRVYADFKASNLDPKTNYTYSLWFKTDEPDIPISYTHTAAAERDRELELVGGNIQHTIGGDAATSEGLNLADGQWHFVVVVVEENVGHRVYVDDTDAPVAVGTGAWLADQTSKLLEFGKQATNLSYQVDQARLYDRVLNDEELWQLSQESALTGKFINPLGMFGELKAVAGGHEWVDTAGGRVVFDAEGRMVRRVDRYGNGVEVVYDPVEVDRILRVHDAQDATRELTYAYNADGRLAGVSDWTGRAWGYEYYTPADGAALDGLLRLAEAPDEPDDAFDLGGAGDADAEAAVGYTYYTDDVRAGLLRTVVNPNGDATEFTYYANRRGFEVKLADGHTQSLNYNLFRNRTAYTDERGHTTHYTHDADGNVVQTLYADRTTVESEWQDGLRVAVTGKLGQITRLTYDTATGNVLTQTDPLGYVTEYTYTGGALFNQVETVTAFGDPGTAADDRVTAYVYNADGTLGTVTDAEGHTTGYAYFGAGELMEGRGVVERVVRPKGYATPEADDYTTAFTYNAGGQVLTTTTRADATGGDIVVTSAYDERGLMVSQTDANLNETVYAYDVLGRLRRATTADPDGIGPLAAGVMRYTYDAVGNLVETHDVVNALTTVVSYDPMQRPIKEELTDGVFALSTLTLRDAFGNPVAVIDTAGRTTQMVYDALNRPTATVAADGGVARIGYHGGGGAASVTDANGNTTRFAYDLLGRVVQEVLADPDGAGGLAAAVMHTGYDAFGNVHTVTDPRGFVTVNEYDKLNRLTRQTLPDPDGYVLDDGFVVWLRFEQQSPEKKVPDEAPGDAYADPGNDQGKLQGTAQLVDGGPLGKSVYLDGSIAFITYSDSDDTTTAAHEQRSVSLWFEADDKDAGRQLLYDEGYYPVGMNLYLDGGVLYAGFWDSALGVNSFISTDQVETGRWHHVLVTLDGSGGSDAGQEFKLYLDGSLVGSAAGGAFREHSVSNRPWSSLGRASSQTRYHDSAGADYTYNHYAGRLDDFRIYNRALDSDDAIGLFNGNDSYELIETRYHYDAHGNLVALIDAEGNRTDFGYDELDRQTSQTLPPAGAGGDRPVTGFAYDFNGNLTSTVDAEGNTTWLFYDALNRPTHATDALGVAAYLAQDPQHDHASAQGELGQLTRTTTTAFDQLGNVASVTDAVGLTSTSVYNALGQVVAMATPDPDGAGPMTGQATRYGYDAAGNVSYVTDANGAAAGAPAHTAWYRYDALGRPTAVTDALGGWAGDPSHSVFTEYDAAGNPIAVTDALGRTTWQFYDALNRPTHTTDALGVAAAGGLTHAAVTDPPGQLGHTATTTYDLVGNVVAVTDQLGEQSTFEYDGLNRQVAATDALGQTMRYTYDLLGRVVREQSPPPGGHNVEALPELVTVYDYDGQGNLRAVTSTNANDDADHTDERYTTDYVYDELGRVVRETSPDPDGAAGPLGRVTTHTAYDEVGNVTHSWFVWQNPDDPADRQAVVTVMAYDALGRELGTAQYTLTGTAVDDVVPHTPTDPDAWRSFDPAADPRIKLESHTHHTYDQRGRLSHTEDAFGSTQRFAYDALGNLVQTATPTLTDDDEPAWLVTRTHYDDAGRMIATSDPFVVADDNGQPLLDTAITATDDLRATQHVYDELGRVVQTVRLQGAAAWVALDADATNPDVYDTAFTPVADTDPTNPDVRSRTETHYDALGRVHHTIDVVGGRTDFYYDDNGRQVAVLGPSFVDDLGRTIRSLTEFAYDALGQQQRVDSGTAVLDSAPNFTTQPELGDLDQTVTDASDRLVTEYDYDHLGRPVTARRIDPGTGDTITTQTEYDALGRVEADIDGLGRRTTYLYNEGGLFTGVDLPQVDDPADGSSNPVTPRYTYAYDSFGNRRSITDPKSNTTGFVFDRFGRQLQRTLPMGEVERTIFDDTRHADILYGDEPDAEESQRWSSGLGQLAFTIDFEGNLTEYVYDNRPGANGRLVQERKYEAQTLADEGIDPLAVGDAAAMIGALQSNAVPADWIAIYKHDAFDRVYEVLEVFEHWWAGDINLDNLVNLVDMTYVGLYFGDQGRGGVVQADFDYNGETGLSDLNIIGSTYRDSSDRVLFQTLNTYDAEGRITHIDSPQGDLFYAYDDLGRLTRAWTGSETGTPNTQTTYTYDELNRLATVTQTHRNGAPVAGETTTYHYDAAGRIALETKPNGVSTTYAYDPFGRLTGVTHFKTAAPTSTIAQFVYTYKANTDLRATATERFDTTGDGQLDAQQRFTWQYDDLNRLVEESFDAGDDGPGTHDYTDRFRYDPSSNRYDKTRDAGSDGTIDETTTYDLDANDRLLSETTDATDPTQDRHTVYEYGGGATGGASGGDDPTAQTGKTVHAGLDALADVTEQHTFGYDLDGRMSTVRIVKYDETQAVSSDVTTTYQYNDAGFRISAAVDDGSSVTTTVYHTDPLNFTGLPQVLEEGVEDPADADHQLGTPAEVARTYTLGLDVIAQQSPDVLAGALLVLAYDAHGSTRGLLSGSGGGGIAQGSGLTPQAYTYDAYGDVIATGFGATQSSDALTNLQYSGEWTNTSTGLQYLRARWYDPSAGVFNRLDPYAGDAGDPLSLNKYQYTHADPISGIDPTGLSVTQGTANYGGLINGSSLDAGGPLGLLPALPAPVISLAELNAYPTDFRSTSQSVAEALDPAGNSSSSVGPAYAYTTPSHFNLTPSPVHASSSEDVLLNVGTLKTQQRAIYQQVGLATQYLQEGNEDLFHEQVRLIGQATDSYYRNLALVQRQAAQSRRHTGFGDWFGDASTAYFSGPPSAITQAERAVNELGHLGFGLDANPEQLLAEREAVGETLTAAGDYATLNDRLYVTAYYAEKATFLGSLALGGAGVYTSQATKKAAGWALVRYGAAQGAGYAVDRYIVNPALDALIEKMELNPHAAQFTLLAIQMYRMGRGSGKSNDSTIAPSTSTISPARRAAIRDALTDTNGNLLTRAERRGVKFTIRRVEAQGYGLDGAIKIRGNQGIDLAFSGRGSNAGRFALAEAKASPGLGSLSRDSLGIRQGSRDFFLTRLKRAGRQDLIHQFKMGNVDLFGGFQRSGRLFQLNPDIFKRDINFRQTPGAATLID